MHMSCDQTHFTVEETEAQRSDLPKITELANSKAGIFFFPQMHFKQFS